MEKSKSHSLFTAAPVNNEYTLYSFLKQSAKLESHNDKEQEQEKEKKSTKEKPTTSNCQSPKRNLSLLRNAAKRTTGACRLPSPSGPRSFTHRAVDPRPPLCSPEASSPAQLCSCLYGAAIKAAGLHSCNVSRGGRYSPDALPLRKEPTARINPISLTAGLVYWFNTV